MSYCDPFILAEMRRASSYDRPGLVGNVDAATIATRMRDEAVAKVTQERDAYRELAAALDAHLSSNNPGIASVRRISAAEERVKELRS